MDALLDAIADHVAFAILQAVLISAVAAAFLLDWSVRRQQRVSGLERRVTRGPESMVYLITAFSIVVVEVIAIVLAFDEIPFRERVAWALFDGALAGYLLLGSGWVRNKTIGLVNWLRTLG